MIGWQERPPRTERSEARMDEFEYDEILYADEFDRQELSKENSTNKVSIKDAINYAIDVIYELNDRAKEPLENPFNIIDDLPKELFLRKFQE